MICFLLSSELNKIGSTMILNYSKDGLSFEMSKVNIPPFLCSRPPMLCFGMDLVVLRIDFHRRNPSDHWIAA
jgi:hypothetical protein